MAVSILVSLLIAAVAVIGAFFIYKKSRTLEKNLIKREQDTKRRMYELSILKELGDRIGYSLNVQNIIDIITGSLHQFIEYSAVSYMFLEPEKIIFKVHLEESVSRKFIDDIKTRMTGSLSALLNTDFKKIRFEEILSGAILSDNVEEPVRSFFNIPLVIAGKLVGVLTIADTESGLYKEEEMTILYKITQQASQAVTRLQEVVAIEEGKLSAMVESMAEGVVMTDKDYRIMVVNPAAKNAIGLPDKKELSIFDFVDGLGGKFDFRGKIEESVKLGKTFSSDEILLQDRFYRIIVSPVEGIVGLEKEVFGCVVVFRDITREKEIEKMREDFTSMIVHELRSPLDTIKKMIEFIRENKQKKAEQLEYFQMMYKKSTDMLELINNLLDVAKIEAGKFQIQKQAADIKQVVQECISFYGTLAQDSGVRLVNHFGSGLSEKVNFDSFTVSQVLNNLVSNAIKFTEKNGKVSIDVLAHKKGKDITEEAAQEKIKWFLGAKTEDFKAIGDSLVVAVTDNGRGIPAAEIGQLFNKFSQVKDTFIKKQGTGLGLAIVKGIIESHQGIIGVGSTEGEGSTFYFTLPM